MLNTLINRNQLNQVVFTGTELSTLTANTQFLFVCKSRQTNAEVKFILPNSSTATTRYDMGYFTETGTTANYTASTPYFSLSPGGYYDIKIYSQYSAYNLNENNSNELVDVGIMLVSGYTQSSEQFIFTGGTGTEYVFLQ